MSVARQDLQGPQPVFARRVELMGTEAAFGFGSRILEVESEGERVIRANLGQPDFPLPDHIAEAVIKAVRDGQTTYCDPQGMPELRSALAEKIAADRDLPEIDPERLLVHDRGARAVTHGPDKTHLSELPVQPNRRRRKPRADRCAGRDDTRAHSAERSRVLR